MTEKNRPSADEIDVKEIGDFISTINIHFGIVQEQSTVSNITQEVLRGRNLTDMMGNPYTNDMYIKALEIIFEMNKTKSEALESLFPIETQIQGINATKSPTPILIDGDPYRKYSLLSEDRKTKYTVFVRLKDGKLTFSNEIKSAKGHTFSHDEILESFFPIDGSK